MERAAEHLDAEAILEHAPELLGRELDRVERIADTLGREREPVRGGQDEEPARPEDASALGHEPARALEVLDHLERHDRVERSVGEGERREVAGLETHVRIALRGVIDHVAFDVDAEDFGGASGKDRGAVPLAAAGIEDVHPRDALGGESVRHHVTLEPVILLWDAGQRPLTGDDELGGGPCDFFHSERMVAAGAFAEPFPAGRRRSGASVE